MISYLLDFAFWLLAEYGFQKLTFESDSIDPAIALLIAN